MISAQKTKILVLLALHYHYLSFAVILPVAPSNPYIASQLLVSASVPSACSIQGLEDIQIPNVVVSSTGAISGSSNFSFLVNCTRNSGNLATYDVTISCQNNGFILTNPTASGSQILYQVRYAAAQDATNGDILTYNQEVTKHYQAGDIGNTSNNASIYVNLLSVNGGLSAGTYRDYCNLVISHD